MAIPYKYDASLTLECTEVTPLDKIASLTANHITSIKGVLTLHAEHIKEITMKSGNVVPMLNHCVITDNTDTVHLALWGTTTKEVTNKFSYIIFQVRVKEFDGVKYLTSTPSTTVTPAEHFPLPNQELFDSFFQTATTLVDQIRLAESFQSGYPALNVQNHYQNLLQQLWLNVKTAVQLNPFPFAASTPQFELLSDETATTNLFG